MSHAKTERSIIKLSGRRFVRVYSQVITVGVKIEYLETS